MAAAARRHGRTSAPLAFLGLLFAAVAAAPAKKEADPPPYDCEAGVGNWRRGWSVWKKAWCCRHELFGCPTSTSTRPPPTSTSTSTRAPTSTSTRAPATTQTRTKAAGPAASAGHKDAAATPHNCTQAKGCGPSSAPSTRSQASSATTTAAQSPSATTTAPRTPAPSPAPALPKQHYDCGAGLNDWQRSWTEEKKAWCCLKADRGCPPPSAPAGTFTTAQPHATTTQADPAACEAECVHEGQAAACTAHIHRVAFEELLGTPDSCDAALHITIARCPACRSCSVESAGCDVLTAPALPKAETPELACAASCVVGDQEASCQDRVKWSAENIFQGKADSCASSLSLVLGQCPKCAGCTAEASGCEAPGAPAKSAPAAATAPPDCGAGREEDWDSTKRQFCCESAGRGCVVQDASHQVKFRRKFERPVSGPLPLAPDRLAAISAGSCLCVLALSLGAVRLCTPSSSSRARASETYLPMREGSDDVEQEQRRRSPLQDQVLARVLRSISGCGSPRGQPDALEVAEEQHRPPA